MKGQAANPGHIVQAIRGNDAGYSFSALVRRLATAKLKRRAAGRPLSPALRQQQQEEAARDAQRQRDDEMAKRRAMMDRLAKMSVPQLEELRAMFLVAAPLQAWRFKPGQPAISPVVFAMMILEAGIDVEPIINRELRCVPQSEGA